MKKRKAIISDKKLRGEWAELCFMVRAAEHGLQISKPWGEMRSYDFIVGRPGNFMSVQVKSTICELGTGYVCTVRGGHTSYAAGSFDFLAAYVVHEDSWYIIPAEEIQGMESLTLYPNSPKAKYEKNREAWYLLPKPMRNTSRKDCQSVAAKIDRIQACIDPVYDDPDCVNPAHDEDAAHEWPENRSQGLMAKLTAFVTSVLREAER